jgi:chromosome segregation protein
MVQFRRLRLSGFKSFVDPTEMVIEKGLTGIVGPNGCGKSNLLEALRWVMGENSPKSMRGAGMEDVIFAGTTGRPSRNFADVTLLLDNSDRSAPAAVNESEELEVTRRIERDMGSAYRINGRDARMRDVQLLFADVATGAHSPALVSQGKIGAIVTAKPQDRRAILEEAAGISGLHGRRKEAEQRLRAAETNLSRIDDVIVQMEAQINALRRQARQAERYRALSNDIRLSEGVVLYRRWRDAADKLAQAETHLAQIDSELAIIASESAKITMAQADATDILPALREREANAAAALQRLKLAAEELAAEELRVQARRAELVRVLEDARRDQSREMQLENDCAAALERLSAEKSDIEARLTAAESDLAAAQTRVAEAEKLASEGEKSFDALTQRNADAIARKRALDAQVEATQNRVVRLGGDIDRIEEERGRLEIEAGNTDVGTAEHKTVETETALAELIKTISEAELTRGKLEIARDKIRQRVEAERDSVRMKADAAREAARRQADALRETARYQSEKLRETARAALISAQQPVSALTAERAALTRLLVPAQAQNGTPVLDQIEVSAGYERALGAALADDLSAPVGGDYRRRWTETGSSQTGTAFSGAIKSLAEFVKAPAALARRLSQIGVVDDITSVNVATLSVGQRIVSRDGQLLRWDGFFAAAPENNAAAERLTNRNRLNSVEQELVAAQATLMAAQANAETSTARASADLAAAETQAKELFETAATKATQDINSAQENVQAAIAQAQTDVTTAQSEERLAREQRRPLEQALDQARKRQAELREQANRRDTRLQGLADAINRLSEERSAREVELAQAKDLTSQLPDLERLGIEIADQRKIVDRRRAELGTARVELDALLRRAHQDRDRLVAIGAETSAWDMRLSGGRAQTQVLSQRIVQAQDESTALAKRPAELEQERMALASKVTDAETLRTTEGDLVVEAETALRTLDKAAREFNDQNLTARENRARLEAMRDNQTSRRAEVSANIVELYQVAPIELLPTLNLENLDSMPEPAELEAKLERQKAERERLGAVNLRADIELTEIDTERLRIDTERNELIEAIAKLRGAIGSLNREGRQRLLDAFEVVNGHFKTLFSTLFGGGDAYLTLIDSDDPLEAGLEIMASPPGKKLQSLTLLSGGEQALTATALIFAVFLTNPSPICVLDEVDAPLDDANVERYCDLLDSMTQRTNTRFLIVTHNAVTMSRMDRLYGVTMAERGVSQLVSVDLGRAEQLLAAE